MPQDIFTDAAFESFEIPVLDDQMPVVRREIQPLISLLWSYFRKSYRSVI